MTADRGRGRPPLPDSERKSERIVVMLTPRDLEILDALVTNDSLADNRQELVRHLLREEYARRVQNGAMKHVPIRKKGSRR